MLDGSEDENAIFLKSIGMFVNGSDIGPTFELLIMSFIV